MYGVILINDMIDLKYLRNKKNWKDEAINIGFSEC